MSRMAWHLYREVLRERRLEVEPAAGPARAVEKQQRRAGTLGIEMHRGPAHGDVAQGGRVAATSVVHVNLLMRRRRVCGDGLGALMSRTRMHVDSSASTVTGQRAGRVAGGKSGRVRRRRYNVRSESPSASCFVRSPPAVVVGSR